MATAPEPVLQAPGAGLPWLELQVARWVVFPLKCRWTTWPAASAEFQFEGQRALRVWGEFPANRLAERVLIRRFPGIEDSSRYWSAAMTLEHLVIVGHGVRELITALRRGEKPTRVARIEDVKPRGEMPPATVRAAFESLLADAADEDRTQPPIPPGVGPRHNHPWFGPIDAHQWHCLLGMHQGIHRKQLERILAGLK